MTGGQVGTLASRTGGVGINATSSGTAGNVSITATDVFSTGVGVNVDITGPSSGNVFVAANGTIDSNATGIFTTIGNTSATGNISVVQNGNVRGGSGNGIVASNAGSGNVLVTGAGSVFGGGGGAGILAGALGPGGGITISGTGAVTSSNGTAIQAAITNAANNSAILVDRSGEIVGVRGINASSSGNGAITVSVSNNMRQPADRRSRSPPADLPAST